MMLLTPRLLLRPWREDDAAELYAYARDPQVGPPAGWLPHRSVADSREIIRTVLSAPETYAVVLRQSMTPVGSIGLMIGQLGGEDAPLDQAELGYWLGAPLWGQGYTTEAAGALLQRGFVDLGLRRVWCAWYDGNDRSRRVAEKCGFVYQYARADVPCPLLGQNRTEHFSLLTREDWLAREQAR